MRSWEHRNTSSVEEACALLREYEGGARPNAGGTDLLGVLKDAIHPSSPQVLVNLKTIPGLDVIEETSEGGLRIGALALLASVANDPLVQVGYPALADAARAVATPQIRNMGTLGGNLCQEVRCWYYRYPRHLGGPLDCLRKGKGRCLAVKGDNRYHAILGGRGCWAVCPSDTAIALGALGASVQIAGPEGRREIALESFYSVLGTVLEPEEILTEVILPPPPPGLRQVFRKFRLRASSDFAIVSVAAALVLEYGVCREARIVLGAVAPTPVRATSAEKLLEGRPVEPASIAEAAAAVTDGARPMSGNGYKLRLLENLARETLLALGFRGVGS